MDFGKVIVTPQSKGSFLPNDRLHKNSYTPSVIYLRHLLAALFEIPGPNKDNHETFTPRLKNLKIELPKLRQDFRQFIYQHNDFGDDSEAWNAILGSITVTETTESGGDAYTALLNKINDILPPDPSPKPSVSKETNVGKLDPDPSSMPYVDGIAGYTSEFCGLGVNGDVPDHLGVEKMAQRLAELIACRETKLPLAIGLFGNWGSGKSYFMNLMDCHIKKLAQETPEDWQKRVNGHNVSIRLDPEREGPWCRQIIPIYFNAWHYIDTNLWASLVTEIFDKLFAHLQKDQKKDELELLRGQLKEAGGALALAEEESERAAQAVKQAQEAYLQAQKESSDASKALKLILDDHLGSLLPQMNTEENRKLVADWLGFSDEDRMTLSKLKEKREEMASFLSRIQMLSRRMLAREGLAERIAWLVGTIIVVPCILWLLEYLTPAVKIFLQQAGVWVKPATTAIATGVAGWWKCYEPVAKKLDEQLAKVESLQTQAEDAQKARSENPEVKTAIEKVERAKAAEVGAQANLATARILEQQLIQSIGELRPERRLGRFIETRAKSDDYRRQLGLVSLARLDFKELSEIFTDAKVLESKIKAIEKSDKPEKQKEVDQIKKLSNSIDRIVLYVDDLDRCPPDKVVDVLQAVHLLLAFPLFAVVVGVDQRCLKQSLRIQFKGLLTPELETEHGNGQSTSVDFEKDERPATPLDYLEKIFHIPFHLPPMSKDGFGTLIEKLSEPTPSQSPPASE